MINVYAGSARMGLVGLVATVVLTTGFRGDAVAKHSAYIARHPLERNIQTASIHETATPARMRYYGGPKSPMWSGQ
jgi:hypothetical protein